MTHAEAKEKVIQAMHIAAIKADCYDECMAINDAMQIACEALDKQMPKKPRERIYIRKLRRLSCFNCEMPFGFWGDIDIPTSSKFCPFCGQAIDWSDEDE